MIRTLKEQLLWIQRFEIDEELRCELVAFKEWFNRHWLLPRHDHQKPAQVSTAQQPERAMSG
ncbi:hypothetical protein [Thioalkalivibrio sp. ALE11]|uniref:hypothetical protein n=1 Tax=Thioalkalivibrio sp. ALE11 TaxID=1265494 RepID=UPI00036932FC